MNMKVYELVSILGLTNEQLIELLWENNFYVKNHMSEVDEEIKYKIFKTLEVPMDKSISHQNNSPLKFVEIEGLFFKHNYRLNFDKDVTVGAELNLPES